MSIFDMFSIGIGPSSSHTIGPMRAANKFISRLHSNGKPSYQNQIQLSGQIERTLKIRIHVYGSLALTGKGHGTAMALILGLVGHNPENIRPDQARSIIDEIYRRRLLRISELVSVQFDPMSDIVEETVKLLPRHSNGMRFMAFDKAADLLDHWHCYSIGGGFILDHEEETFQDATEHVRYPYRTAAELLDVSKETGLSIDQIALRNEEAKKSRVDVDQYIDRIWNTLDDSITAGVQSRELMLPGILKVPRRAPSMYSRLKADNGTAEDFLSVYAMAVNEENAAGGRVVTAPTNGAAGSN